MKTMKVIKSKKPKTKSRIAKTKKPTQQPRQTQQQTQNVTVNVSAPRKRLYNTKIAIAKRQSPPITQGLPVRMNNPLQAPIIINKDTNQLSELIKSLQVKVNAEPPRVENTLEKKKAVPIETHTEEFDEQDEYNRLERANKKLSLATNLSPVFIENKPLSLLGEIVTTDYPTFTTIGTQTGRSYRLGDLLRESGQHQEVEDLYRERQQVIGRKAGPDTAPSLFGSNPASTSLLSSVIGAPALEYVEPLVAKQEPPPLVAASSPPSLVTSVEQSTSPEVIDALPLVEAAPIEEAPVEVVPPPEEAPVEEASVEVVPPPEEPPAAEIPLAFGGTFAPVKGLEELNLPKAEKLVPSSLIEKPYLGGIVLPPIEAEGLVAVKVKQENVDLFPKQGQGLLGPPVEASVIEEAVASEYNKAPSIRYQELAKSLGIPYAIGKERIKTEQLKLNIIASQPKGYELPIYKPAKSGQKPKP
jgi:hypothetical protein